MRSGKICDGCGCEDCTWHSQCAESVICEYFHPIDDRALVLLEYRDDMRLRMLDYIEILEQFGGDD